MIDHESEIFHSLDHLESLINSLHGMHQRAGRMMRTAEGFTATGTQYKAVYRQSEELLSRAIKALSEERAALIQLQIDAVELRRLNAERGLVHLAIEEDCEFAPGVEEMLTAEEAIKD